jgi:predicted nucleotidyltransferase
MKTPQPAAENGLKEKTALFSDKIDLIKSLILNSVNEEVIKKVYLFGSYAYGEPSEDSDIDLCVVIGNKYKRSDIYLDIAINLSNNDIRPCDLLVYNEKYFVGAESGKGIENTIMNRGTLLYGQ